MASRYENYLDNVGREGFSNTLQPGQYVAYGSSPSRPSSVSNVTTNIPMVANMPELAGQGAAIPPVGALRRGGYPQIARSSLPPINVPAVSRPQDNPMINPLGRPMSPTEAMLRGQALRGEGMSVAARRALQDQMAGEAGSIAAQNRMAEAEQARMDAMEALRVKAAGWRGQEGAVQAEKDIQGMKAEQASELLKAKQDYDKAKNEYNQAQIAGRQDLMLKTRESMQSAQIKHDLLRDKNRADFATAQYAQKFEDDLTKMGIENKANARALIYREQMDALDKSFEEPDIIKGKRDELTRHFFDASNQQAAQAETAPTAAAQGAQEGDLNGDGKIDATEQALMVTKTINRQQADDLFRTGKWTKEQLAKYERALALAQAWSAKNKEIAQTK